jgi:serine protease Do
MSDASSVSAEAVARAVAEAGTRMVEAAQRSVVQVRSGGRGAGAGVIWDSVGLVLTNDHVVRAGHRSSNVRVTLQDSRSFDADLVRHSRGLDLALLRLRDVPDGLPTIPVGDSDALRVGELVYAVGHPWGRLGAVTAGIVSGMGATRGPGGGSGTRYVQSDVALAPGNSGGPLLNARGEVVGINAMVFGRLALSIPSKAASAWVAGAGRPPARLGIGALPVELSASMRREGTEGSGLVIAAVEGGGPADRAGLLVGDVLLGAADGPLADVESLLRAVARAEGSIPLRVMRGGKISIMDVPLGEAGQAA